MSLLGGVRFPIIPVLGFVIVGWVAGTAHAQPVIDLVNPASVTYGMGSSVGVTIYGSGFVSSARIDVVSVSTGTSLSGTTVSGSTATETTPFVFVNTTQLKFYWEKSSLAPGSYDVRVTNPNSESVTSVGGFTVVAPQPSITSANPNTVIYGINASASVTVSGAEFVVGATIEVVDAATSTRLSGTTVAGSSASASVPYVHVSSSQVRFYWPNTSLSPGSYTITIRNPTSAGGAQGSLVDGFIVTAPQPVVSSSSPTPVIYGVSASGPISLFGSEFIVGATVTISSSATTTTLAGATVAGSTASTSVRFVHVNASRISIYWPNTALAPGSYTVRVTNPPAAGQRAGELVDGFVVAAPQPRVDSASPTPVTYGSTSAAIAVFGAEFVVGSTITVSASSGAGGPSLSGVTVSGSTAGASTPFVFVNSSRVSFYWPGTSLPAGTYTIRVSNPAAAGGLSAELVGGFVVSGSEPTITLTSPNPVTYGVTVSSAITVFGSNFQVGATVEFIGPRPATAAALSGTTTSGTVASSTARFVHVSSTRLSVYWSNSSLSPGDYEIRVTNSSTAGGLSGSLADAFTVTAPTPTLTAVNPTPVIYDQTTSRAITVSGSNFVSGATLMIGTPTSGGVCDLPTCLSGPTQAGSTANASTPFVFVRSTQLSFYWEKVSLTPGAYNVTVQNPTAAGGQSAVLAGGFTVDGPVPGISAVTPSEVEYGVTLAGTVTIDGSFFYAPRGADLPRVRIGNFDQFCPVGTAATATTPCVYVSNRRLQIYREPTTINAGTHAVRVTNPRYAGAVTGELPNGFRVTAPQPTVLSVKPVAVTAGITASRVIDILGADDVANHLGFAPGAMLTIANPDNAVGNLESCVTASGTAGPSNRCVFVGPGLIRFYWDTAQAAADPPFLGPGTYDVTVTNPAASGGLSHTKADAFRVTSNPEIISVGPAGGIGAGARRAEVILATAGFGAGTTVAVQPDGSSDPLGTAPIILKTGFRVNAAEDGGSFLIDVSETAAAGERSVVLTSSGGTVSFRCPDSAPDTCKTGLVINPAPVVTSVTPSLGAGATNRTLTILGQRFVSASPPASSTTVILPSGISGVCTVSGSTMISCANVTVAPSLLPGAYSVVVVNPDYGRTTGVLTVNAAPSISSITPGFGPSGSATAVTITGTGFQAGLTVTVDAQITASIGAVSSTAISASLTVSAGAASGYHPVTVTNPDGGSVTIANGFSVGSPPPDTLSAIAAYGREGVSAVQYRPWQGTAWSGPFTGPALSAPPVWQVMKASPIRDERILAVIDEQRRLTLHVWNGLTWGHPIEAAASVGLVRPTQAVDVAYEQQTGRAVVVYARTDSTSPRYRTWDGATWSAEALVEDAVNGQPTSALPLWVRLEARPATNDVVLAYEDASDDIGAFVWRGANDQWNDAVLLTTTAAGHDGPIVDVAFERLTGRMMVGWAAAGEASPHYRVWSRDRDSAGVGGWGSEITAPSLGSQPLTALRLVGDQSAGSNRIAVVAGSGTTAMSLAARIWDGTGWSAAQTLTSNLMREGLGQGFDVAWEGIQGELVATYVTSGARFGAFRTWTSGGGWSGESALPLPAGTTVLVGALESAAPAGDPTVSVCATARFPSSGTVAIDAEMIRYTTMTETTSTCQMASSAGTIRVLSGLTRGVLGTTSAAHAIDAAVTFTPFSAWVDLDGARGTDSLVLSAMDTQGRIMLSRWTGSGWADGLEAQSAASGLVSVLDSALGRSVLVAGHAVTASLAQHLAGSGPGIVPPGGSADVTAPGTPTLALAGTPSPSTIGLSWTAVGDDGSTGMVTRYELRRSPTAGPDQVITPTQAAGGQESVQVIGLEPSTLYTFELRALDEAPNASAWSPPLRVTTAADQPPPAVTLTPGMSPTANSIGIQWTAPVDDSGPLAGYQVRYAVGTAFDFDTATPYTVHPPQVFGTTASLVVDGLVPGTTYSIGVKSIDARGQSSAVSNVLTATTVSTADAVAPAAITDLAVFRGATTNTSLLIRWTATGDDGALGQASAYDIRYATSPLTEASFATATQLTAFAPGPAGAAQELVVTGLVSNTMYYFAVKVLDDRPNSSAMSNIATGHTALRRGYTLVSVPLLLVAPNHDADAVFGDDVGIPPYAFRWNPSGPSLSDGCYEGTVSTSSFPTCGSLGVIAPGLGYYLYSSGTRAILDATGSAVPAASYDVPLELGFNMVGNPYGSPIALGAVRVKRAGGASVPYAQAVLNGWVGAAMFLYDGVTGQPYGPADPRAMFSPWNGAWIQSFVADAVLEFVRPVP